MNLNDDVSFSKIFRAIAQESLPGEFKKNLEKALESKTNRTAFLRFASEHPDLITKSPLLSRVSAVTNDFENRELAKENESYLTSSIIFLRETVIGIWKNQFPIETERFENTIFNVGRQLNLSLGNDAHLKSNLKLLEEHYSSGLISVASLLNLLATKDNWGKTPLHDTIICREALPLLKKIAEDDVSFLYGLLSIKDKDGKTPLDNPVLHQELQQLLEVVPTPKFRFPPLEPQKHRPEDWEPPTPKMIGHALGGFMLQGSSLEGETTEQPFHFAIHHIDTVLERLGNTNQNLRRKLLSLREEFQTGVQRFHEIKKLIVESANEPHQSYFATSESLLTQLENLKEGEKFLIPAGWSGKSRAHALLYRIEKQPDKTFKLTVINTGGGAEYHVRGQRDLKRPFIPIKVFTNLSLVEGELDISFFRSLLEREFLRPSPEDKMEDFSYDQKDIYLSNLARFKDKEVPIKLEPDLFITGQRSGVCALKSVLIEARLQLGRSDYKLFKHELESQTLLDAIEGLGRHNYDLEHVHELIHIVERGSKKLLKSTHKLLTEGLIEKSSAEETKQLISQILDRVEGMKNLPHFRPLTTLADVSSDKLLETLETSRQKLAGLDVTPVVKSETFTTPSPWPTGDLTSPEQILKSFQYFQNEANEIGGYSNRYDPYVQLKDGWISMIEELSKPKESTALDQLISNESMRKELLVSCLEFIAIMQAKLSNDTPQMIAALHAFQHIAIKIVKAQLGNEIDKIPYQKEIHLPTLFNCIGRHAYVLPHHQDLADKTDQSLNLYEPASSYVDVRSVNDLLTEPQFEFIYRFLDKRRDVLNSLPPIDMSSLKREARAFYQGLQIDDDQKKMIYWTLYIIESKIDYYSKVKNNPDIAALILYKQIADRTFESALGVKHQVRVDVESDRARCKLPSPLSEGELAKSFQKSTPHTSEEDKELAKDLFNTLTFSPSQNATIANSPASGQSPEATLLLQLKEAVAEPSIQVPRLIKLFAENPEWYERPIVRQFFESRILEKQLLLRSLNDSPQLGTQLLQLLKLLGSTDPLDETERQRVCATAQLTQRILLYIIDCEEYHPQEAAVFAQLKKDLLSLRNEQREILDGYARLPSSNTEKALIAHILAFTHPTRTEPNPSADQIRDFVILVGESTKILEAAMQEPEWQIKKNLYDPTGQMDLKLSCTKMMKILYRWNAQEEILNTAKGLLSLKIDPKIVEQCTHEMQFPWCIFKDPNGAEFRVDLFEANVKLISNTLHLKLSEFTSPYLLKIFGDAKTFDAIEWIELSKDTFRSYYNGYPIQLRKLPDDKIDFSMEVESGKMLHLVETEDWPLPLSLKTNGIIMCNLKNAEPAAILFSKGFDRRLATVQNDGSILVGGSKVKSISKDPVWGPLSAFMTNHVVATGRDETIDHLTYMGIVSEEGTSLAFVKSKDGKFHLKAPPIGYRLAEDQSVRSLRGHTNHLVLEKEGQKQVLLINTASEPVSYRLIPLSKSGKIKPENQEQRLLLAYTFYQIGDYAQAIALLQMPHEPRFYSTNEIKLINALILDKKSDPWAASTKILAASQYLDAHDRCPPSSIEPDKSMQREIDRKQILSTVISNYNAFIGNRNVPEKFQPSSLLGSSRELRLLVAIAENFNVAVNSPLHRYIQAQMGTSIPEQSNLLSNESLPLVTEFTPGTISQAEYQIFENTKKYDWIEAETYYSKMPLTRPGKEFIKCFNHMKTLATHKDRSIRMKLWDRLLFMSNDPDPINKWGCALLAALIIAKENGRDTEDHVILRGLRNNLARLETWNNYINNQLSRSNIQQGTSPSFTPPSLSTERKAVPEPERFGPVESRTMILTEQQSANWISTAIRSSPSVSLGNNQQIESLAKRLKLPQYVVQQLNALKAISEEDSTSVSQEVPSIRSDAPLQEVVQHIRHKIKPLENQRERLTKEIQALANKMTESPEGDLVLDLERISETRSPITLETCLLLYLHHRWDLLQSREPKLSDEEIRQLHGKVVEFLQGEVARKKCKMTLELLEGARESSALDEKTREEIGKLLSPQSRYDASNNPALLLFEYASGWTLSPAQINLMKDLTQTDAQGHYKDLVMQMIMGGGKSSVISPIIAEMKADGTHLSLYVLPDGVYETGINNAAAYSRNLFGQPVRQLLHTRDDNNIKYLRALRTMMEEAIIHREYLVTRPKDLLSLELSHAECRSILNKMDSEHPERKEWEEKAAILRGILRLLGRDTYATFDEADTIYSVKYQLNYTFGDRTTPPKAERMLIKDIYRYLQLDPFCREKMRLHENKQSLISPDDFAKVKTQLVAAMLERFQPLPGITKDELIGYCSGQSTIQEKATANKLSQLFQDPKYREEINCLAILRREVDTLLRETTQRRANVSFGLSKDNPTQAFAIPNKAVNTPNESAQIADVQEAENKTFQLYACQWLPAQTPQLCYHIAKAIHAYRKSNKTHAAERLVNQFERATGFALDASRLTSTEYLDQITHAIQERLVQDKPNVDLIEMITDFVDDVALGEQLYSYSSHYNGTTQDLDTLVAYSQNYSGTLGSQHTLPPRLTCMPNPETDREITRGILQQQSPIHSVSKESPSGVLKELFKGINPADAHRYRAMIDTGPLFIGKSNREVAEEMLTYFSKKKMHQKGVLFWDDATNKPTMLVEKDGVFAAKELPTTQKEDVAALCKELNIQDDAFFTFYSEKQTIGSDLFYPAGACAFCTASSQTIKDKAYQGIMRMRQFLLGTHQIEFVIQNDEYKTMSKTIHDDPKSRLSPSDLILHLELTQSKNQLDDNYIATRLMMKSAVRQYCRNQMLDAKDEATAQAWYTALQPFIEENELEDAFIKFGQIDEYIDTDTALGNYLKELISNLKVPQGIDQKAATTLIEERLQGLIDRQINAACLPEKVPGRPGGTGIEVQRENERKAEKESEKESQKQVERELWSDKQVPSQETPWTFDPYTSQAFLPQAPEGMPSVHPIAAKLETRLISEEIYVTDNFLQTLEMDEMKESLGDRNQKGVYEVLVTREGKKLSVMLLSTSEAAYMKDKIAQQKREGVSTHRDFWLAYPDGSLVQEGTASWADLMASGEGDRLNELLLQAMFLSGNIRGLNGNIGPFSKWIENSGHSGSEFGALLKKMIKRSAIEKERYRINEDLQKLLEDRTHTTQ